MSQSTFAIDVNLAAPLSFLLEGVGTHGSSVEYYMGSLWVLGGVSVNQCLACMLDGLTAGGERVEQWWMVRMVIA